MKATERKSIVPQSLRLKAVALMPKFPKRYSLEDMEAFLITLAPDQRVDGEEYWGWLDELATEDAWHIVERCKVEEQSPDAQEPQAPPSPKGDRYMSTREVADYLGLSEKAVQVRTNRGDLPGHKFPPNSRRGCWRFLKAEVDKWLKSKPNSRFRGNKSEDDEARDIWT
jgi:excisionase family DNA binding protein